MNCSVPVFIFEPPQFLDLQGFQNKLSFCYKNLMILTQTFSRITGNIESEVEVLWFKVRGSCEK